MASGLPPGASADATDEILIELKRLGDNYQALDDHVESLNKHTVRAQVDVEMLLNRSTNNNKHLQTMSQLGQSIDRVLQLVEKLPQGSEPSASHVSQEAEATHRLAELNQEIMEKERRAAALDADYEQMKERIRERHNEFIQLQKDYLEFQTTMQQQLKSTMGRVMVSTSALLDDADSTPSASSKMQRITSMLRERYKLENGSRRVVSTDSVLNGVQGRILPKKRYVLNPRSPHGSPMTPDRTSYASDEE
ncbi:(ZYRO0C06666g) [Zygosaccharomyces parabailii]|uniref:BN860_09274g1_1 n=1 Tax=Zygosaccharomyces bailii (strain CLIB 213 / ATCC 58445 / CBS 680 / BCRC 21525 / NBRC 1098 / NCYC 1416 / NRRL Y-2227) TaxID=1333698 RepID=A0A8J2X5Y4_ZYGB2|nr:(ZYRO0C06666g) [Zygosaccharomyces parabailii]CDF87562.1 BN860_09274g1_1 [Zygosaccharomyces bailii CLIB 213]CDH15383.1 uncharacterized protein ZBAI_07170 [Zygosaccharomyces bailii ISA1307]SJM87769.1 uncharacterized protein ZBIST_3958 [Zygosaccharomyces bailii]